MFVMRLVGLQVSLQEHLLRRSLDLCANLCATSQDSRGASLYAMAEVHQPRRRIVCLKPLGMTCAK